MTFTRTITSTIIKSSLATIADGEMTTTERPDITVTGKIKIDKASRIAAKKFKEEEAKRKEAEGENYKAIDGTIIVTGISTSGHLYSMDMDTFMLHATKGEPRLAKQSANEEGTSKKARK